MKNPKSKYYQIPNKSPDPVPVPGRGQTPNSKEGKVYDIRDRTFRFAQKKQKRLDTG